MILAFKPLKNAPHSSPSCLGIMTRPAHSITGRSRRRESLEYVNVVATLPLALTFTYNQSIFQSDIVTATLLTHFTSISSLKPHHKSSVPPIGALVLSLQAVCSSYLAVCMLNNSLNRSNEHYCTGRQAIRMSLMEPKVTSPRTTGFNEGRGKTAAMLWSILLALWSRWPMHSSQINGAKSLKRLSAMRSRGRSTESYKHSEFHLFNHSDLE